MPNSINSKLKETRKEIQVNEIKSVYGKTNLREYLIKNADKIISTVKLFARRRYRAL